MIDFINRYKYLFIVLVIILGATIAVHISRTEPFPEYMPWYRQTGEYIYGYFEDWAGILGATGTFLLALFAFWTIRERRRDNIANDINSWAKNSLMLFASADIENKSKTETIAIAKKIVIIIDTEILPMVMKASKFDKLVHENILEIEKYCTELGTLEEPTMENIDKVSNESNTLIRALLLALTLVATRTS